MSKPFLSTLKGLKKRKKLKGPSESPSPLPSQPSSRALTPSLIPSAADSSSKADLDSTETTPAPPKLASTPSDYSTAKATALNVFKIALKALGSASDNIPVPGLKPAMEGLLGIIEKVQV
jgi:hypothetical protein